MAQRGYAASFQFAVGSGGHGQERSEMSKMTKAIAASVSRSSDLASYESTRSDAAMARVSGRVVAGKAAEFLGKGKVGDKLGTGNRSRGQNRPEAVGDLSRLSRAGSLFSCLLFGRAVTGTGGAALLESFLVGAAGEKSSLGSALLSSGERRDSGSGVSVLLEAQEAVAEQSLQQRGFETQVDPLSDDKLDS